MWIVARMSVAWMTSRALEGLRQHRPGEVPHARPEADVAGGRVLRLDAAHPLDDVDDAQRGAVEQMLPGEQRAVQPAGGEERLSHSSRRIDMTWPLVKRPPS